MADGMLVEVQVLDRGSAATAAAAVGATSVSVEDVTPFDPDGGTLSILGVSYDFTAVDSDALTVTLATGLTVGVDEFDPVLVVVGGDVARDWLAVVDLGGGDAASVPIPYALRAVLPEGAYNPPVPVTLSSDYGELLGLDRAPVIDGGFLDPNTLPDPVVTVGSLLAQDVITEALQTRGIEVGAGSWDSDGFRLPVFNVPFDGSPASLTVQANLLSAVVQNLRVQGATNYVEGSLVAANGVTAPVVGPRVSRVWPYTATGASADLGQLCGLYDDGTRWLIGNALFGGNIQALDKTTGVQTLVTTLPTNFNPLGGVTKVGTSWYVLGRDDNRSGNWYVYIYNASWAKTGEWMVGSHFTGGTVDTTDGTNLILAGRESDGTLYADTRNPATGAMVSSVNCGVIDGNPTSTYYGSADFGGLRIVVTTATTIYVFNTSGVRQTAQEWAPAVGQEIRGLAWDGTRFHSIAPNGRVYDYSTVTATTSRSVTYTKYDGDAAGGNHETTASPATTFSQRLRTYMLVEWDPVGDGGGVDDPDRGRVYVDNHLQTPDVAAGVQSLMIGAPGTAGASAPTLNGFSAVGAGSFISTAVDGSANPLIDLRGDGYARAPKLIQSSTVSITPSAANTPTSVSVTFAVPFTAAPAVQVTAQTNVPGTQVTGCGAFNVTTTGCDIYVTRTNTTTTTLAWTATAKTQ